MAEQTKLEKVKEWIATFPSYSILSDFQVDYTDQVPSNGGIFPNGLVEVTRRKDILGNVTVTNQLNFGIYCVFEKAPNDNVGATINQEWIASFQDWVQEQSVKGLAPVFGDSPKTEVITAQNGELYDTTDEGWAMYMVQLTIQYVKNY